MKIRLIDTYYRVIAEPLGIWSLHDDTFFDDRTHFSRLPPHVADLMKENVAAGRYPATRQPEDSIVWSDTEIIITWVWYDLRAARERSNMKLFALQSMGLKSSVVVVDDEN